MSMEAKQGICFFPMASGILLFSTDRLHTLLFTRVSSSVNSREPPYPSRVLQRSWIYQEPLMVSLKEKYPEHTHTHTDCYICLCMTAIVNHKICICVLYTHRNTNLSKICFNFSKAFDLQICVLCV